MPSYFKQKKLKSWQKKQGVFSGRKINFQKRKRGIVKILKWGFLLAPVFLIFYFVLFSEFFAIKKIDIKGNQTISSESIEEAIKKKSFASVLGIFFESNFFLNNKEKTEENLLEKFPEIKNIKIEKKFPDALKVEITEKNPLILWCRTESCYYLDSEGTAFISGDSENKIYQDRRFIKIIEETKIKEEIADQGDEEAGSKAMDNNAENKEGGDRRYFIDKDGQYPIKEDKDGKKYYEKLGNEGEIKKIYLAEEEDVEKKEVLGPIMAGEKVADSDFVAFALELDSDIKSQTGLKIIYYKTKGVKTREIIAYTDKNVRIYFNTMDEAKSQVKYLKDFLSKGIEENKKNTLEYIYLKSGNKVFYK
jgi:hypothetical protein